MKFETNDGFIFESNNKNKVKVIEQWWTDNRVTVYKLKNILIYNRHNWMLNLMIWGWCNLTEEYWEARDLRQQYHRSLVDNLPKNSSKRVFMQGLEGYEISSDYVYDATGWRI